MICRISEYQWRVRYEPLYCSKCSDALIDPYKESTGDYFTVGGHVWEAFEKRLGKAEIIVFAVCADCQKDGEPRVVR